MGRLIDADDLERYIDNCDFCDRCPDASPRCQIDCEMPDFLTKRWKRVIDEQSTVDAEPVKHGKWIDEGYYADYSNYKAWHCSKCNWHMLAYDDELFSYCPMCGAKMDAEEDGKCQTGLKEH